MKLPFSFDTIPASAIQYFSKDKLKSVVITSGSSIDDSAFDGCSNLETVYYTGTQEEWEKISTSNNDYTLTDANIIFNYVPEN